ncbi:MAG TPA: DUF742 domain-containing protein [Actinomycetota bacterium]|jgi:Protein of unknown function (DUF742)
MRPDGPGDDRVVPVYAFTAGRTRPTGQDLPLEAVVTAAPTEARAAALQSESLAIVTMCARPQSLAEVGAALQVPVGVARVLVGDLVNAGYLVAHLPRHTTQDGRPSQAVLGRLLDGLRTR